MRHKIVAILFWVAACFLLASLSTYTPHDIPWESAPVIRPLHNGGGIVGAYVAYGLLTGLGWSSFLLAFLLGVWGWMAWQGMTFKVAVMRLAGTAVCLLSASALWGLGSDDFAARLQHGGVLGVMTAEWLYKYLGLVGAYLIGAGAK